MSVAGGLEGLHFINTMSNAGLKAGAAEAEGIVNKMGVNIGKLAPFAPLAAGALILNKLGNEAYDFSREFDLSMKEIQTISKATQENLKGISDEIINMSANGADSANELAKGFYQIVSAGYDWDKKGREILEISSKLSTGARTTVFTSADAITSVLNAYGDKAGDVTSISDKFFEVVKNGKTTMSELGSSIVNVTGLAAQAGVKIDDLFAAYAQGTKTLRTDEFTTGLRGFLTSIIKPSDEALETAKQLGIEFNTEALAVKGLNSFLQDLMVKTQGNVEAMATLFPNVRGLSGVFAIGAENGKQFAEQVKNIGNSFGNTENSAKTMMEAVDNKWKQVHNRWMRELKDLGDTIKLTSSGLADLFNALLTNQDDLTNKAPVIGGFQDRVAANRMLGDNKLMSYINAMSLFPSSKNKSVESRLQEIIEKAQEGFSEKENQLSKILGIDNAVDRAKELSEFLSAIKNERADETDIRTIGDESVYKLRSKNWENIISLIEDAIKKADEFDNGGGGGDDPKPKVWTASDSLKKIDELKSKLGTGNVANEIELRFKIADEQAKINEFAEKVREAFEKAINEGWYNSKFNRTVGADGTNSPVSSIGTDTAFEPISKKAQKYREETRDLTKQLAPMKQLTAEEEKQLKAESKKAGEKRDQAETEEELAKKERERLQTIYSLFSAVTQITEQYGEQLGLSEKQSDVLSKSLGAMSGIARMASGDVVGGATQLVTSALDLFITAPEKLSEQYANLREQINGVIEAANIANETLSTTGSDMGALKTLALIQAQLTGLIDDAERLNKELPGNNERYGRTTGESGTNIFRTADYNKVRDQINELNGQMDNLANRLLSGGISKEQTDSINNLLSTFNDLVSEMDSITESLIGTTISGLSDSLADAFLNGEDAAKAWGDTVDSIIGNIAKNQLIAQLLTKPVTDAVDSLISDMADQGGITNDELVDFVSKMNSIYDDVAPAFQAAIQALSDAGINIAESSGYSGLQGISRGLTEETGSLIVGQFSSMREYQIKSNDSLASMSGSMMDQLAVAEESLGVLEDIRENTSFNKELVTIRAGIGELNNNIKTGFGI